jgi:hypothetical protein
MFFKTIFFKKKHYIYSFNYFNVGDSVLGNRDFLNRELARLEAPASLAALAPLLPCHLSKRGIATLPQV